MIMISSNPYNGNSYIPIWDLFTLQLTPIDGLDISNSYGKSERRVQILYTIFNNDIDCRNQNDCNVHYAENGNTIF